MNWNERLEELLQTTDYEDLSAPDQAWLSECDLSPEQYRQWQQVIRQSRVLLADQPTVPARINDNLKAHFRQMRGYPAPQTSYWRWVAAAAALAGAFLVGRWSVTIPSAPVPDPVVEYIRQTDTIYQELIIEKEIIMEVPVIREIRVPVQDTFIIDLPELLPIAVTPRPAPGRSARDDAKLLDMVVEVY